MSELLPCPFCGSQPVTDARANVWCNNDACAIVGTAFSGGARHWNRRAPAQQQDSGRDAALFSKMLQTCTEAKIKYHRDNRPRQITMVFRDSVQTSLGYRNALRKTLAEFEPIPIDAAMAAQQRQERGKAPD